MTLADFMLPQIAPGKVRLADLAGIKPPGRLFAGYDPRREELLVQGNLKSGVTEIAAQALAIEYKGQRNIQFVNSLPTPPKQSILWDMDDARAFDSSVYTGLDLNVFQYNRRVGSRHAVLWRLQSYFEPSRHIGHAGEVNDVNAFADKKNTVFWRGAISGSRWADPFRRVGVMAIRDVEGFNEMAGHFSRLKAALISDASDSFDMKLTIPEDKLEANPWMRELGVHGELVKPAQQLEHKYILCLNGNDVASNLYWVASTRSLAFKEDCAYEVLPDYFLKPWVHFVPIARGLGDLQEKFDYCEANPGLCEQIIANANEAYAEMIDPQRWNAAELEVCDRLGLI